MRYELMLPREIRAAIDGNWPVVLAVGVLEYHGEHMAVGMDTLAVVRILEILETDANLVILPPFSYGAASYAVERPERTGTLHVDAEALMPLAKAMFTGLLRIGFRNIHLVIHHQTENFVAGMPTDLAFKLAARQGSPLMLRFHCTVSRPQGAFVFGGETVGYETSANPHREFFYAIGKDNFGRCYLSADPALMRVLQLEVNRSALMLFLDTAIKAPVSL